MKTNVNIKKYLQSWFSDIKSNDNLWFRDYFAKTIFQITVYSFCRDKNCH